VGGDAGGADLAVDGEQVGHLEGSSGDGSHGDVDVDDVVEFEGESVLQEGFEDGHLDAGVADLVVRVADVSEVFDAGFLHVGEVAAVVDDAHGVGLGEADADGVGELVVARVEGGFGVDAHCLRT